MSNFGLWIDINDPFNESRGIRDERGGYSATTEMILHEMFHAFEFDLPTRSRVHSNSESFWKLVGFRQTDLGFEYVYDLQSKADRANALRGAARVKAEAGVMAMSEWWAMSRSGAFEPLPSEVAMIDPAEAFAEIGAHLVLDPTARTYLDPKVVQYFEREVFVRR